MRVKLSGFQAVTRAIKADLFGTLSERSTFDLLWTADGFGNHDNQALSPAIVYFASADPTDATSAPFDAVLANPSALRLVFPDGARRHGWESPPLPLANRAESELNCLATAIYFEARGESRRGQVAVAQVVTNRVKNPAFPKTICGVVYQNKNELHRCQFSFTCDGIGDPITDKAAWREAMEIAREVVSGGSDVLLAEVGNSTHYHATYVSPLWASKMRRTDTIGHHVFYVAYRRGSSS